MKDIDIVVVADVGMQPNGNSGLVLLLALDVAINGLDQVAAEEIIQAAHATYPIRRR